MAIDLDQALGAEPLQHEVSDALPGTRWEVLFYRFNGDLNPVHADPGVTPAAGTGRPFLHGPVSYGSAATAVVDDPLAEGVSRGQTLCPEHDDAPVLTRPTREVLP